MRAKQLIWSNDTRQYANGQVATVSGRILFNCFWDSCRSIDNKEKPYLLKTRLPISIKPKYSRFASIDEAKTIAQAIFERFIRTSIDTYEEKHEEKEEKEETEKESSRTNDFYCDICMREFSSKNALSAHLNSVRHKRNLNKKNAAR